MVNELVDPCPHPPAPLLSLSLSLSVSLPLCLSLSLSLSLSLVHTLSFVLVTFWKCDDWNAALFMQLLLQSPNYYENLSAVHDNNLQNWRAQLQFCILSQYVIVCVLIWLATGWADHSGWLQPHQTLQLRHQIIKIKLPLQHKKLFVWHDRDLVQKSIPVVVQNTPQQRLLMSSLNEEQISIYSWYICQSIRQTIDEVETLEKLLYIITQVSKCGVSLILAIYHHNIYCQHGQQIFIRIERASTLTL